MNADTTERNTSSITNKRRKRIKINLVHDVIKFFYGSSDTSDNEKIENVDKVAEYIKAKISYPTGQSVLQL